MNKKSEFLSCYADERKKILDAEDPYGDMEMVEMPFDDEDDDFKCGANCRCCMELRCMEGLDEEYIESAREMARDYIESQGLTKKQCEYDY